MGAHGGYGMRGGECYVGGGEGAWNKAVEREGAGG